MTTEQIDAIEAGPEMDRMVAQACDLDPPFLLFGETSVGVHSQWKPSTDWTDAMHAAERFGLLRDNEHHDTRVLGVEADGVWVIFHLDGPVVSGFICRAPTGPLAICRAILKLHVGDAQ